MIIFNLIIESLAEETQRKRRILQDLENELRNKARKHAEQHTRLQGEY